MYFSIAWSSDNSVASMIQIFHKFNKSSFLKSKYTLPNNAWARKLSSKLKEKNRKKKNTNTKIIKNKYVFSYNSKRSCRNYDHQKREFKLNIYIVQQKKSNKLFLTTQLKATWDKGPGTKSPRTNWKWIGPFLTLKKHFFLRYNDCV